MKNIEHAIQLSRTSVEMGGFPVGAVIMRNDEVIATGVSNGKELNDPTSHAEIATIRDACRILGTRSLRETVLYSSMEPCIMCLAASSWASIPKIVYAVAREKLDPQHFEGEHNILELNSSFRKPIELIHDKAAEADALQVVSEWELSVAHPKI